MLWKVPFRLTSVYAAVDARPREADIHDGFANDTAQKFLAAPVADSFADGRGILRQGDRSKDRCQVSDGTDPHRPRFSRLWRAQPHRSGRRMAQRAKEQRLIVSTISMTFAVAAPLLPSGPHRISDSGKVVLYVKDLTRTVTGRSSLSHPLTPLPHSVQD